MPVLIPDKILEEFMEKFLNEFLKIFQWTIAKGDLADISKGTPKVISGGICGEMHD